MRARAINSRCASASLAVLTSTRVEIIAGEDPEVENGRLSGVGADSFSAAAAAAAAADDDDDDDDGADDSVGVIDAIGAIADANATCPYTPVCGAGAWTQVCAVLSARRSVCARLDGSPADAG